MRYLLISTDHLTDDLLFRDNEDFRAGMNYTAVVSHVLDVHPLAFILMSNHVHYILYTSKEMAKTYMDRLKQLYGRYFQNKYGEYGKLDFSYWRLETGDTIDDIIEKASDIPKKYHFNNNQELNLGEYNTYIPNSDYSIDSQKDIIAVIKNNDTILKCNVRERWQIIATVAALSPGDIQFMTVYSNDTYLGRFASLNIDSASVTGYWSNFELFKKTGK